MKTYHAVITIRSDKPIEEVLSGLVNAISDLGNNAVVENISLDREWDEDAEVPPMRYK
jgi:hypothetical protein